MKIPNKKVKNYWPKLALYLQFFIIFGSPWTYLLSSDRFWHNIMGFYLGNYTEKAIQRVAKSMNMRRVLKEKLVPQYQDCDEPVTREVLGHRKADWTKQLQILVQDIQVYHTNSFSSIKT